MATPDVKPWSAPATRPARSGDPPPPPPSDVHVEYLREKQHPCWLIAYMRDLTRTMSPTIKSMNPIAFPTFIGRAFTVSGPDVYLSALEGIPPGSVYVQGNTGGSTPALFSPGWTHAYVKPRGGVAVVVDGGVYKSFQCEGAAVSMFAAFATPAIGINRREGRCNEDVVCGGIVVGSGDIILGDADGVVVIPSACEDEFFAKIEAFVHCNGCFGKVAARAMADGVPMTEEPALADMFERKYANPECYWREYESWWAKWKDVDGYGELDTGNGASAAFYSKER